MYKLTFDGNGDLLAVMTAEDAVKFTEYTFYDAPEGFDPEVNSAELDGDTVVLIDPPTPPELPTIPPVVAVPEIVYHGQFADNEALLLFEGTDMELSFDPVYKQFQINNLNGKLLSLYLLCVRSTSRSEGGYGISTSGLIYATPDGNSNGNYAFDYPNATIMRAFYGVSGGGESIEWVAKSDGNVITITVKKLN